MGRSTGSVIVIVVIIIVVVGRGGDDRGSKAELRKRKNIITILYDDS